MPSSLRNADGGTRFCASAAASLLLLLPSSTVGAAPLPHSAYIWQREWTPAVHAALTNSAPLLTGYIVLAAEGKTRFTPDYAALRATGKPYGLALRLKPGDPIPDLNAAEIQLDYDCPESKLDGYRQWLAEVRRHTTSPVTITALPCWLRHETEFRQLVAATDGFVLQVHSIDANTQTLCDTNAARRAIAQAARFGKPFRVALPTYSHPGGLRADPAALAALVRDLNTAPPTNMTGIIWYRLPVAGEQNNWRWPTLAALIAGNMPQPLLAVELRRPQPGLVELDLLNTGNADAFTNLTVTVRWRDATLLACDALAGFAMTGTETNAARFVGNPRLAPGERRVAGWLRFRETKEVSCEVNLLPP